SSAEDINAPDFHGFGGVLPISANGSVARISLSLNLRRRLKHLMENEHFDIVHCHEPLMPALPLAVLNYSRSVNIGTFHAYAEGNLGYLYARPVLQRFFNRLDGLIAVSEPARAYAQQYFEGGPDWRIIPNGVDIPSFSRPSSPFPRLVDGRPNVLFLGRFEEDRKGFKYALRALRWVRQSYPDVRLVVVGHGDPERYAGRIKRYGLWPNVEFVGVVSNEDRARYMASCRLFIAPNTHGESQGIVLLEAMAAGMPVVASDIPGYASILRHGHQGLLVQPQNEHSLAIAMVRLLADRALAAELSTKGRRKAEEYGWPKISRQILEYYEEVGERKRWESEHDDQQSHLSGTLWRAWRA
ncbi:MAG: glycosyltransferase family 4 protein, partial [Chloroflexota bacterium]|nr:glycosyltransferase family 4 protein [Chloroflexota bacterium]